MGSSRAKGAHLSFTFTGHPRMFRPAGLYVGDRAGTRVQY